MKTKFNFTIGNANLTIDNTPVSLENINVDYEGEMNAQELTATFGQLKDLFKMIKDASEPNRRKTINNNAKQENPKISVPAQTPEPDNSHCQRFKRMISILTDLGFKRTDRHHLNYEIRSGENPIIVKTYISSMGWLSVSFDTRYSHVAVFDITEEEGRVDYAYKKPNDITEEDVKKIEDILQRMKNIK